MILALRIRRRPQHAHSLGARRAQAFARPIGARSAQAPSARASPMRTRTFGAMRVRVNQKGRILFPVLISDLLIN